MLTEKTKAIGGLILLALSFATGRYLTPDKIKIETKIVEVEKKTSDSDTNRDKHRETITVEKTLPDGTTEKTTKTTEDTQTDRKTHSTDDLTKTETTSKEITKGDKVTVAALTGVDINLSGTSPIIYGGIVSKPILGPVTVGVWGLSNATAGLALGLTF